MSHDPLPGPVLVTGATGRQGGAAVRRLLARGASIRALTRDPESARAQGLAEQGVELEIAGSELTNEQAAEVFARVLGRKVRFLRLLMPIVRLALGKEFFQMFRWFNDSGYQADVAGLRAQYPELELRTLEDWLRQEGWESRRAITAKRDKLGRPLVQT